MITGTVYDREHVLIYFDNNLKLTSRSFYFDNSEKLNGVFANMAARYENSLYMVTQYMSTIMTKVYQEVVINKYDLDSGRYEVLLNFAKTG